MVHHFTRFPLCLKAVPSLIIEHLGNSSKLHLLVPSHRPPSHDPKSDSCLPAREVEIPSHSENHAYLSLFVLLYVSLV